MSEFKQCPNGHYYQGDHCPYCGTGEKSRKTTSSSMVKICANHHAYITKLSRCPICGSSVVVDKYNWGQDTIDYCVIRIDNPIQIIIKDQKFSNISQIIVHLSRGNRYGYSFSDGCSGLHNNVNIEPDEEIKIGETTIKGKELMRMCDVILDNRLSFMVREIDESSPSEENNHYGQDDTLINNDNQDLKKSTCGDSELQKDTIVEPQKDLEYKQCPNGHYYQGDHCPYCNGRKLVKIGRSIDNDYIVDNPQISEHHCQIEYFDNSQYRIVDYGSSSGRYVNGNRVEGSCPLQPFDEVSVGGVRVPWMHHFASTEPKDMGMTGVVYPDDWNE